MKQENENKLATRADQQQQQQQQQQPLKRKNKNRKKVNFKNEDELLISPGELKFQKPTISRRVFQIVLGLSALLDFLSCLLPAFLLQQHSNADEIHRADQKPLSPFVRFFSPKKHQEHINAEDDMENDEFNIIHMLTPFLKWLDKHSVSFGILFSLLWFADAFVKANQARVRALRKRDKKRLLENNDKSFAETTSMNLEDEGCNDKLPESIDNGKKKNDKNNDTTGTTEDGAINTNVNTGETILDEWLGGGWGVYIITMTIQLLLLPVGFYLLCYHVFRLVFAINDYEREVIGGQNETETTVRIEYRNEDGVADAYTTISTNTQYCVGYALIHHSALVFSHAVTKKAREKVRLTVVKLSRRMAKFAIRNPRRFRRRLQKALRILRWVKYLAPLIGTFNKLLGNTLDLIKKYKQNRAAAEAQRIKKRLWKELSKEEREKRAAVVIQSNFRASQARKAVEAMKIFQGNKEKFAALRLQRVLRGAAARARARVLQKRKELKALQDMERHKMKKEKTHLSAEERRRMYELQEELTVDAKTRLGRKMLLRPNTKFAVTWKVIFVICVIIEITQLAFKPKLDQYKDAKTGKTVDFLRVLEEKLIPTPITEWEQCGYVKKKKGGRSVIKKKKHPRTIIDVVLNRGGDIPQKQKPKVENKGKKRAATRKGKKPWYCHPPYTTIQAAYIDILRFVLTQTLILIGIICFLDVFVTFFTGELDSETGCLVPKPFFVRWLLPGLVLQLLVNPMMAEVSVMVKKVLRGAVQVGPVRALRWSDAFFFPVILFLVNWFEANVWIEVVKKENYKIWK